MVDAEVLERWIATTLGPDLRSSACVSLDLRGLHVPQCEGNP
jgi:hypothetical protein